MKRVILNNIWTYAIHVGCSMINQSIWFLFSLHDSLRTTLLAEPFVSNERLCGNRVNFNLGMRMVSLFLLLLGGVKRGSDRRVLENLKTDLDQFPSFIN